MPSIEIDLDNPKEARRKLAAELREHNRDKARRRELSNLAELRAKANAYYLLWAHVKGQAIHWDLFTMNDADPSSFQFVCRTPEQDKSTCNPRWTRELELPGDGFVEVELWGHHIEGVYMASDGIRAIITRDDMSQKRTITAIGSAGGVWALADTGLDA